MPHSGGCTMPVVDSPGRGSPSGLPVSEITEGNVTTIEGKYVKSVRHDYKLPLPEPNIPGTCTLCDIDVKYTDVLILSQYVRPDGEILPRELTGLCAKKQFQMNRLILQAQQAGLMPNHKPETVDGNFEPISKASRWQKNNVYFKHKKRYQIL